MVYQRSIFKHIIDRAVPGACYLCRGTTRGQAILCADCKDDLPEIKTACLRCGSPRNQDTTCINCQLNPLFVDKIVAPFHYTFPVNELIRHLKYNQKLILTQELGQAIAMHLTKVCAPLPEYLLPVPLHRTRHVSRGFNQAAEIADSIGRELSLPVNHRLLQRKKNTLAQVGLGSAARKRNIKDAFIIRTRSRCEFVAIVDDVITTGATVNEAARLLKLAGVRRVEAWACARGG